MKDNEDKITDVTKETFYNLQVEGAWSDEYWDMIMQKFEERAKNIAVLDIVSNCICKEHGVNNTTNKCINCGAEWKGL